MAFHVACPITCKRICFCKLGFPQNLQSEKAKHVLLEEIVRLSEFLTDPLGCRVRGGETVQVSVPKVVKPPPVSAEAVVIGGGDGGGGEGDEAMALSAQTKRVAMQKKAAVASMVAEDYARRFECGDVLDASRDLAGEEQGPSSVNVMCRMCFYGENEGSERARRMLSCKTCSKKYHRSCIKNWAQHRDLFHWSSWTCPSCRICELCRRTGDPNKFLFCKRCDGAYHCYCQHPPHKIVCEDCPVCLKVYRDSESTPMVCCDVCERWVHCQCDGISDEKYLQFQVDGNLQYKCATCRGECYEVKDLEDAVKELWRRRDEAGQDLIANQRAAAGLPTQEEIFSILPYSDDDEDGPILLKNDFGRSLKFSLKGLVDKSPKKSKEHGKKSSNKKNFQKKEHQTSLVGKIELRQGFEGYHDAHLDGFTLGNRKNNDMHSHKIEKLDVLSIPAAGSMSHSEGICSINQPGVVKHKFVDEVTMSNEDRTPRTVPLKSYKAHGLETAEDTGKNKSKTVKGTTKLVIHLGSRNKNVTNSPRSDASSCQREQDLTTSNGSEDTSQQRTSDKYVADKLSYGKGDKHDNQIQLKSSMHGERESNSIKHGKMKSEISDLNHKYGRRKIVDGCESTPKQNMHVVLGKRISEGSTAVIGSVKEVPALRGDKISFRKHPEGSPDVLNESKDDSSQMPSVSPSLPKDSKPLLKLKFKNPYHENQSSWVLQGEEEKSFVKGQRSKRKRPSPFMEKTTVKDDEDFSQVEQGQSVDEIMDANWILKKLGKDAIGKRVEVHLPFDNSWYKGEVADVIEGTSILSVDLDDGRSKNLELGKQRIRFVSEKQKRF